MKKAYNLDKVNEIAGGDESFTREMVGIFLKDVDANISQFQSLYSENKMKEIASLAYKLKPTVDLLGIEDAHHEIRDLRTEADSEDSDNRVFDLIQRIAKAFGAAAEQMREDFSF